MSGPDLATVADRTRLILERAPPANVADRRSVIVEPVLLALGWDMHGPGCTIDASVAGTTVEYLFSLEERAVLLVGVDDGDSDRRAALLDCMQRAGIDHGLAIDGETIEVLGHDDVAPVPLEAIDEHESELDRVARSTLVRAETAEERTEAVQQLALERDALASTIAAELVAVGGEDLADEFERAAEAFVDRLLDVLEREPNAARSSVEYAEEAASDTSQAEDPSPGEETEPVQLEDTPGAIEDEEGEFVAKFFDGSASIGAIGDGTSVGAFTGAVEYLLERGLSGIGLPWPQEDDAVVLNREPVGRDGDPMAAPRELSNGYYLEVAGSVADRRERLEELARRAGLRVMFTGDW